MVEGRNDRTWLSKLGNNLNFCLENYVDEGLWNYQRLLEGFLRKDNDLSVLNNDSDLFAQELGDI